MKPEPPRESDLDENQHLAVLHDEVDFSVSGAKVSVPAHEPVLGKVAGRDHPPPTVRACSGRRAGSR